MEVELDDALLTAQPCEELAILAICALGWAGRHRVLPQTQGVWDAWAETLPPDLEDQIKNVWKDSLRRSTTGSASEQVRVVPTGPHRFDEEPVVLTPSEALNLLGRPLRVLLENGRYDRAFLLAFADAATHKALVEAEQAGWLVFETAGGIKELEVRALDAATHPAPREVFRTIYLCDSDARLPGQPDAPAVAIGDALMALGARYHRPSVHFGRVLARRAAENYAPPGSVLVWATKRFGARAHELFLQTTHLAGRDQLTVGTGNAGSARRHLLAAIALRELEQRKHADVIAHFDMKHGRFYKGNERNAPAIWAKLDAFQRAALEDGFGAGFSDDFYGAHRALEDSSGEIAPLLSKIVERV
ncbi:hypothetical protein WME91_41355 [Sorangium sp. So ce269]